MTRYALQFVIKDIFKVTIISAMCRKIHYVY